MYYLQWSLQESHKYGLNTSAKQAKFLEKVVSSLTDDLLTSYFIQFDSAADKRWHFIVYRWNIKSTFRILKDLQKDIKILDMNVEHVFDQVNDNAYD